MCLCWDCEAIRDAIESGQVGKDENFEEVMEDFMSKAAVYRCAELKRRKKGASTERVCESSAGVYFGNDLSHSFYTRIRLRTRVGD